jgi:hypothetical protein
VGGLVGFSGVIGQFCRLGRPARFGRLVAKPSGKRGRRFIDDVHRDLLGFILIVDAAEPEGVARGLDQGFVTQHPVDHLPRFGGAHALG